jgi:hypothetical protein
MKQYIYYIENLTIQCIDRVESRGVQKKTISRPRGSVDFIKKLASVDVLILSAREYRFDRIDTPHNKILNNDKKSILKFFAVKNKININSIDLLYRIDNQRSYCFYACLEKATVINHLKIMKDKYNIIPSYIIPAHFCWLGLSNIYGINNYIFIEAIDENYCFFLVENNIIVNKYTVLTISSNDIEYYMIEFGKKEYNIFCLSDEIKKTLINHGYSDVSIKNLKEELKEIYSISYELTNMDCMAILTISLLEKKPFIKSYALKPALYKGKKFIVGVSAIVSIVLSILIINVTYKIYFSIHNTSIMEDKNSSLVNKIKQISLNIGQIESRYSKDKIVATIERKNIDRIKYFLSIISPLTQKEYKGVWLNKIAIEDNGDSISLEGESLSRKDIMFFYHDLKKHSNFKNLGIKNITKIEGNTFLFIFNL